jgi:hypothetical protein
VPTLSRAWQYPVQEVTINNCLKPYEEPCTFVLPVITGADYISAKNIFPYQRIYKVLWGATDSYGWDMTV